MRLKVGKKLIVGKIRICAAKKMPKLWMVDNQDDRGGERAELTGYDTGSVRNEMNDSDK
jgi:hypothetical protein